MTTKRNNTLLLASTLTVMAGATIAPSLPAMAAHFAAVPYAHFWVQLLMTLPGLMIALTAPWVGRWIDGYSKKRMLLMGVIVFALAGCSALLVSNSLFLMLLGRVFLGLSVAMMMVTCSTLFSLYYSGPERGHYLGLQAAFSGFGGVFFIVIATLLAAQHWLAPFALYGIALFLVPCVLAWVQDPQDSKPNEIHSSNASAQADESLVVNKNKGPMAELKSTELKSFDLNTDKINIVKIKHIEVESNPLKLKVFCALAALEILALYCVPLHMPFYVEAFYPQLYAGYFIAGMLLLMSITATLYGRIQHIATFAHLHSWGLGVVAVGFVVWAMADWHLAGLIIAMLLIGVGLGILRPNLISWLMSRCPHHQRGAAMGKVTAWFFIGQFFCPMITLPVLSLWGYSGLCIFMVCGCLLGVLIIDVKGG